MLEQRLEAFFYLIYDYLVRLQTSCPKSILEKNFVLLLVYIYFKTVVSTGFNGFLLAVGGHKLLYRRELGQN